MPKTKDGLKGVQPRVTIPAEWMPLWEEWCFEMMYSPTSQDAVKECIRRTLQQFSRRVNTQETKVIP